LRRKSQLPCVHQHFFFVEATLAR
ncbi:hypothetical protein CCACVL1_25052, partial [Corchorus capsularis]